MFRSFTRHFSPSLARSQFRSTNPRFYSTLLLCEHRDQTLNKSTLSSITAATQIQQKPLTALVVGAEKDKVVAEQAAKVQGVDKVIFASNDKFLTHQAAEAVQAVLEQVMEQDSELTHVVAPHSVWGKNVLPRLAAVTGSQPVTDVIQVESDDQFVRPIYAGNAISYVKNSNKVKLLSFRPTAFDKAAESDSAVEVSDMALEDSKFDGRNISEFVKEDIVQSDRPELAEAGIVVSGGRGLKNGENFKILYELADLVGGAVGATRAVVDAGYVSNDMQVGQTGKVVAPELYIACGISGQLQHIAGMKDSKCIVAINKDPEAPFFQVADYGLVDDLFNAVPKLTEMVKKDKQ